MPASLAPITPELLADFRGGKESALELLFRANFDALTAEAAETLHDAATAQKVVASCFLEVWDHRDQAQSASQFESMLRQALGAGVTHEQRRRATLHRMADTDGDHKQHAAATQHHHDPESADKVWAHIVAELHAEKTDPKVRAQRIADRQRHGAASHIAHVAQPSGSILAKVGIGLIAVLVAAMLWYLNRGSETTKAAQALARENARPMVTKAGQRGKVTLEDSTIVSMGASSVVRLTSHFPQDFRALQVNGTAAFNAPAAKDPLLIHVGEAWIVAQDAEFAVRHFADDSTAMIKVTRGKVTVRGAVLERSLEAGATLQVNKEGAISDLSADQASEAFSWVDGKYVVINQSLANVLKGIKIWYGLDILARDTSLNQRPITMTASLESSGDAVAALETSGSVKHAFEKGGAMIIVDAPAAPAKKKK